jgi:hypothetical protein
MQRLIARLLLLVALAGNFIPLALAATAAPPHACCIRKTHKCHSPVAESEQLALREAGSCSHDCCRGVTTARWAQLQSSHTAVAQHDVTGRESETHSNAPTTVQFASQSTRAPPAC